MPAVNEMVLNTSLDSRLPLSEKPRARRAMLIRSSSSSMTKM